MNRTEPIQQPSWNPSIFLIEEGKPPAGAWKIRAGP